MTNIADAYTLLRAMTLKTLVLVGLLLTLFREISYAETSTSSAFKVGVITSLSGPNAEYGQALANGIELARRSRPARFAQINFLFEDAISDSRSAVSAFNKLVELDRVDLVYVWGVQFCTAVAPLAEERGVPMVAQCVNNYIAKDRRFVVRFMNYAEQYARTILSFLEAKGLNNIGVIATEQPYIEDMREGLYAAKGPGQKVTLLDSYLIGQTDFRPSITKLRHRDFEALGVFLVAGQVSQFYKQLKEQKAKLPTFGTNFFETQSEVDLANGAMDGAVFANHHVSQRFQESYKAAYGNLSQLTWAALAYEFAALLPQIAWSENKKRTGPALLEALSALPPQEGEAAGHFEFKDIPKVGRFFEFALAVKRIEQGRIVELGAEKSR